MIQAGVQKAEDDPFVTESYRFLPGEYVYVTFSIAGFTTRRSSAEAQPRISLVYSIVPEDLNNVPLALPDSGKVETELSAEDKNWVPKHRSSFLLPSFIASGNFQVRIAVRDDWNQAEVVKTLPLRIGGVRLQPTSHVTAENFRFQRSETDAAPLELAAYRAGDTAYAQFEITGFKFGAENTYKLRYGLTVFRPDGKVYVNQPNAAELSASGFYPAQFVPGRIAITTSADSRPGPYKLVLKIFDQIAKEDSEATFSFQIE